METEPQTCSVNIMRIGIEISPGELLDKVSILEIKNERIQDQDKLGHVRREMETLNRSRSEFVSESDAIAALYAELKTINEQLWVIEDDIRLLEKASDFGEAFIALARSVYITNDRRAGVKRAIDELLNSDIGEVKSYA
jgi:hypothetical protein